MLTFINGIKWLPFIDLVLVCYIKCLEINQKFIFTVHFGAFREQKNDKITF